MKKLFGVHLHPCTPASYTTEAVLCVLESTKIEESVTVV